MTTSVSALRDLLRPAADPPARFADVERQAHRARHARPSHVIAPIAVDRATPDQQDRLVFSTLTLVAGAQAALDAALEAAMQATWHSLAICNCPSCRAVRAHEQEIARISPAEAYRDLLQIAPMLCRSEVLAVRAILGVGLIDGSLTTTCLFGVVASLRGSVYGHLGLGEHPDRPFEAWLSRNVRLGDTPRRSRAAALLAEWLETILPLTIPDGDPEPLPEQPIPLDEWLRMPPPTADRTRRWRHALERHVRDIAHMRSPGPPPPIAGATPFVWS